MTTVASLLEARADDEHLGLIDEERSLRWCDVVLEARRRAGWLRAQRTDGPPHVGVLLPNGVEYLLWIFASALARWCVVGINPTRRGDALAADIRATDCQLIITDDDGIEMLAGLKLGAANDRLHQPGQLPIGEASHQAEEDAEESDLLLLLFTSGTTGTPKAVRCTQGRLAGIAESAAPAYGYSRDDVCYCPMPLFHGNALMALVAPALLVGATIALRPRFTASGFLDDVRRYHATTFTYVGKAIAYLLATEERPDDADNTLERAFGTEASATDRARFEVRFGCRLVEGYGSSEGGVAITTTPETPPGALGPAPRGSRLAVLDPDDGTECAPAQFDTGGRLLNPTEAIGEIVNLDGAGRFEGYYRNDTAVADRLRSGWYWTGDLAYRDEAGYFYFAGRSGDWLRVDSENLAAAPIEDVLARYEGFASVAVYPAPDVQTAAGDVVMAAIELRPQHSFDPAAFARWLTTQADLGTKWAPTLLRIVDKLDETVTGKITKVRLREETWHTNDLLFERVDETYVKMSERRVAELDEQLARTRAVR